ncbi:MerR family transcriptional regulator [Oceanospirillum maris]|uniref:MerR family transcriptional regulator n=1 Tax=Oceanospirillum maris TaxID=64977 RepID=UPI000405EF14|nr:MerR family transcriptional regulator [Oceanospirillum maris]
MKLYRIGQVSKLYGISVETLRHYEKLGLLLPSKVTDSGYRYYDSRQIWKLNLIRTLRKLDLGLSDIAHFIQDRTLDSSAALLNLQLETIAKKKSELEQLEQELKHRQAYLEKARAINEASEIRRQVLPERKARILPAKTSNLWEVDRIHKEIESQMTDQKIAYFAWGKAGVLVGQAALEQGEYHTYKQVFIFDEEGDDQLTGGDYLCLYYRGESPEVIAQQYQRLRDYMNRYQLEAAGPALEIYKLDIHETDRQEEYLTEIQIPYRTSPDK